MSLLKSRSLSVIVCYFVILTQFSYTQGSYFTDDNCETPDGEETTCRAIYECQPLLNVLKTLRPPYSAQVHNRLNGFKCPGRHRVCCPSGPITLDPRTSPDTAIVYHNRDVPPDVTNHKNIHLLPKECGFLDTGIKITNGDDAKMNEFPWMALLRYKTPQGLEFLCGGSIINSRYILTAAHCIGQHSLDSVRIGEHSIRNSTDCEVQNDLARTVKCNPPVQDLKVEEIIIHPQYKEIKVNGALKGTLNDIALIRVSKMSKSGNVSPVCMPIEQARDWNIRSVFVTGWGLVNSQTREQADILQKVGLPYVDQRKCAQTYSELGVDLTKTQLCAGGEGGKAFCSGDSGGPMVVAVYIDGFFYVQHGIVSIAPSYCEIQGYPGVFTGVKFYMDWILDNMKP